MPIYQKHEDKLVIAFSGNLDTVTCIDFEDELFQQLQEQQGEVVFDLSEVGNIASMFLRICTKAAQKTDKGKLSIVNVGDSAMKVFELTRLDKFLSISPKA